MKDSQVTEALDQALQQVVRGIAEEDRARAARVVAEVENLFEELATDEADLERLQMTVMALLRFVF